MLPCRICGAASVRPRAPVLPMCRSCTAKRWPAEVVDVRWHYLPGGRWELAMVFTARRASVFGRYRTSRWQTR